MTTLNDFAPYPKTEADATPEAMARNALVSSWINSTLATAAGINPDEVAAAAEESWKAAASRRAA